ncbi:hypothetical protein ACS5PN_17160 [Roseateles sp. NT4]|uniref:hypothetical protein n=1 Tax=Roseateles sp. NT4 TaxID=3453715 RepID=UPI003EEAA04F
MRSFALQIAGQQLNFDTDGDVQDSAKNVLGRWKTAANRIVYTPTGGSPQNIDVDWAFNDRNQLTIAQNGTTVCTLVNTLDGLVGYHLEKNVLFVDPDGDLDFVFQLDCLFGLNGDGNLIVSINGKTSVLDGFIEDTKSRFRFRFDDKEMPSFPSSLVFSGIWERLTDPTLADQIRLHFALDDKKLEIAANPLNLPAQVQVSRARNHLEMVYQSKSSGERRLQFQGSLEIKTGFTLFFSIDDVKDGGVRRSVIKVETTFDMDIATGFLRLSVGRNVAGTAGQTIELGGSIKTTLKNGTLSFDFNYRKDSAGGQSTKTIAAGLSFESKSGNKLFVNFTQEGNARTVDVTGKISTAKFTFDGRVQIKNDAQGRSLSGFFGLSW